MRQAIISLLLVMAVVISGCATQITNSTTDGKTDPNEQVFCTEDAKMCPDGTSVVRDAALNCDFPSCPGDDLATTTEEFRKYVDRNVTVCAATTFICVQGTQQFFDETGCGCEPKEPRKIVSSDLDRCAAIRYTCEQNYIPFSDEAGCGCQFDWNIIDPDAVECPQERPEACTMDYNPVCGKAILNTGAEMYETYSNGCVACSTMKVVSYKDGECSPGGKLQAFDCIDPRPTACTKEYVPVCGQVQVDCIRAPCDPVKQTFGNKCDACANERTISYFQGACEDENLAGGTVLAGSNSEQCTSIGGRWTGYDCEGIDQNQCQEIGGTFNECASACRNNPAAEICTMQCVPICEFD